MGCEDLLKGFITRIYLKNFLLCEEMTVKPGRHLNLIIGPNGAGKSSVANAIILGMGGSPKVIGRVSNIAGYIKYGKKRATIEIDLNDGAEKIVTIRRSFDKENHSTWMIDGEPATHKKVAELVKSFNIQVENLCQFLPQDKVGHFSGLSSTALLLDTEKCTGDPKLVEYHEELKTFRKDQAKLVSDLASKTELLAKEEQTCDSLRNSVTHINEQRTIKERLDALRQKKAWMLFETKKAELERLQRMKNEAKTKKDEIEKELKPVEREVLKVKNSVQSVEKISKQRISETSTKKVHLGKLLGKIEKLDEAVEEIISDCKSEIKDEENRDSRINDLKEKLDKMQNDLRHLMKKSETADILQNSLDEIDIAMESEKQDLHDLETEQGDVDEEISDINRKIKVEERMIQEFQNTAKKRLDLLKKISSDTYKGVLWLRNNQDLFSHPVHEPMLLHINVDFQYSRYFENIISKRDLTAFVCEDKKDMNTLIKYLRGQERLKINVVHSNPNNRMETTPRIPLDDIKIYGFEHYMASLIDAPEIILKYLINMYRLHEIPIGNNNVDSNLERLPETLKKFFSSKNLFTVSRSKFSGEKIIRQNCISSSGVLKISTNVQEIENSQFTIKRLSEQRNDLIEKSSENLERFTSIQKNIEKLKKKKAGLRGNVSKMKKLRAQIDMISQKIEGEEASRRSVDDIRSEYKEKTKTIINSQLDLYQQYNQALEDLYKNTIMNEEFKYDVKVLKGNLTVKENGIRELRHKFTVAETQYKLLMSDFEPLKRELGTLYKEAKKVTDGIDMKDPRADSYKKVFAQLPASMEEILDNIRQLKMKYFSILDQEDMARTIKRYNDAEINVERLRQMIKEKGEQLEEVTQNIEKIKDQWIPLLTKLIEKINNNFSSYLKTLKCGGEVVLVCGADDMDFENYGLEIRVKFRSNDALRPLSRHFQSGGERAVATAVYVMALQEVSRAPFCCVDEINQGMDATNEREIFKMMVNISSRPNYPQYFLLTPKLLPNLEYSDSVTVLTVFKGQRMLSSKQFNMSEHCQSIIRAAIKNRDETARAC